ncbi:MAG: TRAP transporter substrate-binding protein DctP [Desulfitobacteriaceae bacterium]|nr:TRAP transporter substrate-binding protein DctP [Desulfitobacteriaceae bacterium]
MKKVLVVLLIAMLSMFAFAGCGGSDEPGSENGGTADGETYSLRLATHYNTSHPGYAALERIAADLAEKSDGAIEISIYPSSQLGDYTLTYEDLMRGAVDLALIPIPSEYDPRLEMNFIPYLVNDYAEMETAFGPESYFFQEYTKIHGDLGVKLLGIYVEGLIGFGFTDLPENYADAAAAKGDMVRCPAIEVYNLVTEDMGYSATTIPYADLYSALQTGVVDGWIGGTPQLNYTDFKDVIKHYIAYNVFAENIGFFMSQKVFDTLPAEYQTMIEDAFMKEAIYSYSVAEELDKEAIKGMEDYGIEIIYLTDEEMAAYVEQVKEKTWPKLTKNIGEDVMNNLVEAMK